MMAISGQWEQVSELEGSGRAPRRPLRLEVHGSTAIGSASVLVRNISATGLLLESALELPVGEIIFLDLPQAGGTRAKVVWGSGELFGCQFHSPISSAALSAAQLQSPRPEEGTPARAPSATPESFGMRLHRLRKDRGLTLSQIAASLGVSKPTVWAWENGKARPVESRIEALANLLDVPAAELLTGRNSGNLQELLATSRERIAVALGTTADKIHILIEP